MVAATRDHD
jgi:hypothetical protein